MKRQLYGRAFGFALAIHGGFALTFFMSWTPSFETATPITGTTPEPAIIKAQALDSKKLEAEIARLDRQDAEKSAEAKRLAKQKEDQKKADQKKEEDRLAKLKSNQKKEEDRLAKLKSDQKKEADRLSKLKKEVEQLKATALKKTKEAEKAKQDNIAKQKALEAEEAAFKEKKASAKKEREIAAAKLRAEADKKAKVEAAVQAAIAKKHEAARVESELSMAVGKIVQVVSNNWLQPIGTADQLSVVVRVSCQPNGQVTQAKVVQSSGHVAFDRSAENAVLKSSPLPLPTEDKVAEMLHDFTFTFKPGDLG